MGDFGGTRMPQPGVRVDMVEFGEWKLHMVERMGVESNRDVMTRGPEVEEIPDPLWAYLYERFVDAKGLK